MTMDGMSIFIVKHICRRDTVLRAIEKQMNMVRLDGQMHNIDVDFGGLFPQQCDQPLGYVAD